MRRLFLVVIHFEDSMQFGQLQKIAHTLAEAGKLHCASGVSGRCVKRDQSPEAAAIDEINVTEI